MFWLISLPFRLLSALIGIAVLVLVVVGLIGAFALGGLPKQYEIDALGGAYSAGLETVEEAARALRLDYCAQADGNARREARCAEQG